MSLLLLGMLTELRILKVVVVQDIIIKYLSQRQGRRRVQVLFSPNHPSRCIVIVQMRSIDWLEIFLGLHNLVPFLEAFLAVHCFIHFAGYYTLRSSQILVLAWIVKVIFPALIITIPTTTSIVLIKKIIKKIKQTE